MPPACLRTGAGRSGPTSARDARYDPRMASGQLYRLRNPSSGQEFLLEAQPDVIYRDQETGEELEIVGKVLPLPPSASRLPWAVENLRFCNWCGQMAQKDLNECPTCGRRMAPPS